MHQKLLTKSLKPVSLLTILITLFLLFLYPANSADLGWHLRYGKYFWENGKILKENTFSNVMTDFIWTNDSWIYDILSYKIFEIGSFSGLSITGSLFGIFLILLITYLSKSINLLYLSPLLYFLISPSFYHGFRAQQLSLIFLTFCIFTVQKAQKNKAKFSAYLFLFTMFTFWANIHAEFMLGLSYISLALFGNLINHFFLKKNNLIAIKNLSLLLFVSTLASLLTPFGIKNHFQAFTHVLSSRLEMVNEWAPWPVSDWHFWALLIYVLFIVYKLYRNSPKLNFVLIIPILAFAFQAFSHRRIQPSFVLVTLPLLIPYLSKIRFSSHFPLLFSLINLVFTLKTVYPSRHPWLSSWFDYCNSRPNLLCSEELTQKLIQTPIKGKLFNYFNWGGYLTYRLPQMPVFIDGRMVSWKSNDDYMPFSVYRDIHRLNPNAKQQFEKEKFDLAIVPSKSQLEIFLLTQLNWNLIYTDEKASLLVPPSLIKN
jgi:hypothetical protein